MISNAIAMAQNEYVVYFLLTSYLYGVGGDRRLRALPAQVKRLPIAGDSDVHGRLAALREVWGDTRDDAHGPAILEEAIEILRAASARIASLKTSRRDAAAGT
jgi:hypothetical protein